MSASSGRAGISRAFSVGAFGVLLISLAAAPDEPVAGPTVVRIAAVALVGCALLVLVATKGRHPGWLGLLVAATLAWLGQLAA